MVVSPNWLFDGVYYFSPERARPCDINSEQHWFKSLNLSNLCFTPGTCCLTASIDINSVLPRGFTNCTEDVDRNNGQAGGCGRKSADAYSKRRDWRRSMARIRHIAIYTDNPGDVAAFYCKAFDLKEVERSPRGAIYLSDGYINIALLMRRSDSTSKGIHHFGFQVDS